MATFGSALVSGEMAGETACEAIWAEPKAPICLPAACGWPTMIKLVNTTKPAGKTLLKEERADVRVIPVDVPTSNYCMFCKDAYGPTYCVYSNPLNIHRENEYGYITCFYCKIVAESIFASIRTKGYAKLSCLGKTIKIKRSSGVLEPEWKLSTEYGKDGLFVITPSFELFVICVGPTGIEKCATIQELLLWNGF